MHVALDLMEQKIVMRAVPLVLPVRVITVYLNIVLMAANILAEPIPVMVHCASPTTPVSSLPQ